MRIDRVARSQVFRTFVEAFSDYAMDTSRTTQEIKRVRSAKNNVDWELSVGAFDGERMVGFTLIAVDERDGELAAYDAVTGIVPEFRGQRLASRMFDHALPGLRRRGVTRFVLEVLQGNESAVRAYRKAGFEIVRELVCFELDPGELPAGVARDDSWAVQPVDRDAVLAFADQLEWLPSWENSLPAVRRIPDELVTLGAFREGSCGGVLAYTPTLNWIMTLVVHREQRRRGAATALVRGLASRLPRGAEPVKLLNVDGGDAGARAFLERTGFRRLVDQYEMALGIEPSG